MIKSKLDRISFTIKIILVLVSAMIKLSSCQNSPYSFIDYKLMQKNLSSYEQLKIQIKFSPSYDQILTQISANQTLYLVFYTKQQTQTSDLYQKIDSYAFNYVEDRRIALMIYNLQQANMSILVNLQYQNIFYYNAKGNIISLNSIDPANISQIQLYSSVNQISIIDRVLSCFIFHIQKINTNPLQQHFLSIIQKQSTINYMLPFNLISVKDYSIFVNYLDDTIVNTQYSNEPFLPTFWNQLGADSIAIPWLPYFSQCTGQKKRILLKTLLIPNNCINKEDKKLYSSLFSQAQCESKIQNYVCLIEQFNVDNPKRDQWFHSNKKDIFYFHPFPINTESLKNYLSNKNNIMDDISRKNYQQIPVLMKKNIDITQKPKQFILTINMGVGKQLDLQIISAYLDINSVDTFFLNQTDITNEQINLSLNDNQVSVHIIVNYYTDIQRFYYLHFNLFAYIIIPMTFTFLVYIISTILQKYSKIFRNFQIKKSIALILVPLLKGLLLSMISMMSFILIFYFISYYSNFSVIGTTFSGDDTIASDLYRKYNGRNGLVLIISGFFILIQSIKQIFKIPSPQQLKISIQDAQQENQLLIQIKGQQTQQLSIKKLNNQQSKGKSLMNRNINFTIKILESRRNKIFLQFIFIQLLFAYGYKMEILDISAATQISVRVILLPFCILFLYKIMCYTILKDLFYAKALLILGQTHFYCTILMKSDTIADFIIYIITTFISFCVLLPFYQIKLIHFCKRLSKQQKPNYFQIFILRYFKDFILTQSRQSYYERGIFFASVLIAPLCSMILIPFLFVLIYLTFQQSKIFSDVFVNAINFKILVLMSVFLIPTLIYIILCIAQFFNKFYDLGIFKVIQLNNFNFKNRKVKWMSDIFRQNPTIANYLKEYEKFHFSSQLYFVLFSLSFAGLAMLIGFKILFQNQYICFVDPALVFIFIIIWIVGDICAMIISFLALKFKFYEKKDQVRMRTKLQSIQKFIRKKQYTKYLQLDAVKQYFLYNHKDWIIQNIQKVFTKSMFLEENGKILKKFKFYKNMLKRKNIMMRRTSINDAGKGNQFYKQEGDLENKISERDLYENSDRGNGEGMLTINKRLSLSKKSTLLSQSLEPKVIKISKQKFNQFAKPLLYYWFYTAKQNTVLKSLVQKIKQQKLQQVCQFCNMDLDLQNIQKHDIQEIINQYRVINVGRPFIPKNFIQYYRVNQQFITVCFQCKEKKLYLQKKRIKNIKYAKIIVMNWLIRCRSNMLQNNKKTTDKKRISSRK